MFMFWLSVTLSMLIGALALLAPTVGFGVKLIGLVLAGNAFVRLQRGSPPKTRVTMSATWLAIAISGLAIALGLLFVRA